ncbi:MAG: hypothetical protein ACRDGE_08465 [Candidatus Limnocylindria bacterium]
MLHETPPNLGPPELTAPTRAHALALRILSIALCFPFREAFAAPCVERRVATHAGRESIDGFQEPAASALKETVRIHASLDGGRCPR